MDNLRFQLLLANNFFHLNIGLVSKNRNSVKKSLTFDRIVISNILKLSYIYQSPDNYLSPIAITRI